MRLLLISDTLAPEVHSRNTQDEMLKLCSRFEKALEELDIYRSLPFGIPRSVVISERDYTYRGVGYIIFHFFTSCKRSLGAWSVFYVSVTE